MLPVGGEQTGPIGGAGRSPTSGDGGRVVLPGLARPDGGRCGRLAVVGLEDDGRCRSVDPPATAVRVGRAIDRCFEVGGLAELQPVAVTLPKHRPGRGESPDTVMSHGQIVDSHPVRAGDSA